MHLLNLLILISSISIFGIQILNAGDPAGSTSSDQKGKGNTEIEEEIPLNRKPSANDIEKTFPKSEEICKRLVKKINDIEIQFTLKMEQPNMFIRMISKDRFIRKILEKIEMLEEIIAYLKFSKNFVTSMENFLNFVISTRINDDSMEIRREVRKN